MDGIPGENSAQGFPGMNGLPGRAGKPGQIGLVGDRGRDGLLGQRGRPGDVGMFLSSFISFRLSEIEGLATTLTGQNSLNLNSY